MRPGAGDTGTGGAAVGAEAEAPAVGAEVVLDVGAVAHGGHCVARLPAPEEADQAEHGAGRVVFVRYALPGERVRAVITDRRPGYLRADAVQVLTASPDRVEPPCPYAGPGRCGGCDFQHATPEAQRLLKADVVTEQLIRLGGMSAAEVDGLAVVVEPLPGDGPGWRSRVQYAVDGAGRLGFRRHRSHEVVAVDQCLIATKAVQNSGVTERRWRGVDGVEVVASSTGELAVLTRRGRHRPHVVSGPHAVHERAAGRDWRLPAEAFWQVHPSAPDAFVSAVLALLAPKEGERALDLYGGVGLFAGPLAEWVGDSGSVIMIESDPAAVSAARTALADLPQVKVVASRVERAPLGEADLVVLDPPRAGAGAAVVEEIVATGARAVAYVACDPAALARDVRYFAGYRWRLTALRAFDAFPMTQHVECVALLEP